MTARHQKMTVPDTSHRTARFQSFSDTTSPKTVRPRLAALRREMKARGLSAYLLPRGDMFRGEYVPANAERLAFLTSFTGSAGLALIGMRRAALFVDGRYTAQAPLQTDTGLIEVMPMTQGGFPDALGEIAGKTGPVGYDPWLFSPADLEALAKVFSGRERLVATDNLVDLIWSEDRPPAPKTKVKLLGANRAGITRAEKLDRIRTLIGEAGADTLLLTLPESVNWLLNMRGRDVPHTPLSLGFTLVPKRGKPVLFIDRDKIGPNAAALTEEVGFAGIDALPARLEKLGMARCP
jgi:Xaa-Pro aminopeptidase